MSGEIRLLFNAAVVVRERSDDTICVELPDKQFVFHSKGPGFRRGLGMLSESTFSLSEMQQEVLTQDGPRALAEFLFYLDQMNEFKLIDICICDHRPLMTQTKAFAGLSSHVPAPNVSYSLSSAAAFRLVDNNIVGETPLSESTVVFHEPDILSALFSVRTLQTFEELVASYSFLPRITAEALVRALIHGSILVSNSDEASSLRYWEFHDLFFHTRSRRGRHNNRYGGTYPWLGWAPSLPVTKAPTGFKHIALPRPESILNLTASISFSEVLEARCSSRSFSPEPIDIKQLGHFLYLTARIKELIPGDDGLSLRPYPSAGARYPLEIYPLVSRCASVAPGVYHYDPLHHALHFISENDASVRSLLREYAKFCGRSPNWQQQVTFVITARFARASWKYESVAYANILKEVGCLCQTMYLVATAMGLGGCMIGGGNSDLFSRISQTDYYEESSVGEFVLGTVSTTKADSYEPD